MVAEPSYSNAVADDLGSDPIMRRDPQMTRDMAPSNRRDSQIRRAPNSSGLYDILDLILDKGIVIDAFVRVSLVGIELVTVDLRVVIASVDTYLRYAEGAERLQLYERSGSKQLPDVVSGGMKKAAIAKGASKVGKALTGGSDKGGSDKGGDDEEGGFLTRGVRSVVGKLVGSDDDEEGEDDKPARKERRPDRERNGSRMAGSRR